MTSPTVQKRGYIRLRAPILGLFFAVLICGITPYNNIYLQATPLGGGHFPLAPFFIFLLLAIISILLTKIPGIRKAPLTGGELLIIWIQAVIGSGIAYTGFARTFLINITAPIHFATMGNRWQEVLHPLLPASLAPSNASAIELLYNGIPQGRELTWWQVVTQIPWDAWTTPLTMWWTYVLLGYLIMIFLINIISRQWIHYERMNFPLLKVPEMISKAVNSGEGGSFFTNRFLIIGLMIPIFLHVVNGLNLYYPSVPQIPTLVLAGRYFSDTGIFTGFHKLKLYFYPAFIGFAFLTSRQISFSFWFFFLCGGLLYGILNLAGYSIPASELGVTFGPTLTRPEEMQMIGAYTIFFIFLLWLARDHLFSVVRQSFFLDKDTNKGPEWIDVRISFWGVLICTALLLYWYIHFGMSPLTACLLILVFFIIMLVATRIICQGGLAYFTLTAAPMDWLSTLFGTKIFAGINGLLAGVSQKVLFVDLRESLMPSLLHGNSVHQNRWPTRLIFTSLLFTVACSLVASTVAMMALCYRYGIRELQLDWATQTSLTVYDNIFRLVTAPSEPGSWVFTFALLGALVMLVLVTCYHRLYWWPIHPLGYLTAYSSAMRILWVSFFIGWVCNALCMRYGGVKLFKKLQFFFVGLIIGDFLMGGTWAIIGLFSDTSYQVLPN